MEASDWITLVIGVCAVAGTLGGVWFGANLAHKSASDVLRAQLAEERRREVTALLTDIAVDGRGVVEAAWIEIPALASMQLSDLSEYIETDSGKANGARRNRLGENLTRALLLVADPTLAHRTAVLATLVRDWAEEAHGPVLETGVRGRRDMDAVIVGYQHVKATTKALGDFELAARDFLTVEVGAVRAAAVMPAPAKAQEPPTT